MPSNPPERLLPASNTRAMERSRLLLVRQSRPRTSGRIASTGCLGVPMSTELDRVKAKIHALATKTVDRGCSEDEEMSAMEKVGKLLEQYNLTMEECDVREEKCVSVKIPLRGARSGHARLWARHLKVRREFL